MNGAAKVNFTVTNLTQTVGASLQGIHFVQGISVRGPFSSPDEVINSWPQFVSKYGGLSSNSLAPLICKRLLEKGGSIRFSRVGNYTDIGDRSTLTAVKASQPKVFLLSFDDAFTSGNEIEVDVNTVNLGTVNYSISSDNTLDNIAELLLTSVDVKSAVVIENTENGGYNNTIAVTMVDNGRTTNFVCNITITGGITSPVETITSVLSISNSSGVELFELKPKYEGKDYNNFIVTVSPGSNGQPGYFNINLVHKIEPTISESYSNLFIQGNPTAGNSNYLEKIVSESKYLDVVYKDLSSTTGQQTPLSLSFQFTGGTDGSLPENKDYIGDSNSRTGLFAFDEYDDSYQLTTLDKNSTQLQVAGSSYAKNRGDLIYYSFMDNKDKQGILVQRESLGDNKYQYIYGGYGKVLDPITNQSIDINPIGDIFAAISASDRNYGEWYSFAGPNRGLLDGLMGVTPNFGAPASYKDLDELANKQVNMVINRSGSIKLWGNFTGQYKNDQERFVNILRLIMFLKKSLRPTLESFLEEPNDIPTWKRLYYTVKPFLDSLVTNRAMYSYEWQGDQNATSLSNLKINNLTDVGNGKYKVNLMIKAIPSIQEINVNIILAPTGVEFEVASELV